MRLEDIHVGDVLRIREWDDMVKEFGVDGSFIKVPFTFTNSMRYLCGQTFTVYSISRYSGKLHSVEGIEERFEISAEMLQPPFSEAPEDNFEFIDLSGF